MPQERLPKILRILRIKRSQLRWFGHVSKMPQESLFYMRKQMGEDQSDVLELDGLITLRILDEIAWDFVQAK